MSLSDWGIQNLTPNNYKLIKDDDTFTNADGAALGGVSLEFAPRWRMGFLSKGIAETFFGASLASGYFQNDVSVQRSGIQPSLQQYKYQLFPADLSAQIGVDLWGKVGAYLSYGLGAEILHQTGNGLTDSVTDVFYGEVATFGVFGNITRSLQLFINFKARGPKVFIRRSTISGNMILAGISIAVTG